MRLKAGEIKRKNIPFVLDVKEFKELVRRVANDSYADFITTVQIPSSSGMDEYEISDTADGLLIRATSGVAAASAFNFYLKEYCGYCVGALFKTGVLPHTPPHINTTIQKKSLFHYRYLYNYCTFGYTYAFHDWEAWEPVLDWALLSGYNLILNPIAQETVWYELLQKIGYSKEDAKRFLVGPAFMPWLLMMNMSDYSGYYPDWWFDEQKKLAGKFNQRLQAFGAGILLPGYCGMVPDNFTNYYPSSNVIEQGLWCGMKRPAYLLPDDTMFHEIASLFYHIQGSIPGASKVHYYSADPFHEGGKSEGINLTEYAQGVFACMNQFDPQAVWAFQGWQHNPKREILNALDKSRTLVMNLSAETNFNAGDNFVGCPWLYCTVNNFGGQHILRGNIIKSLQKPFDGLDDNYTMVGIGLMPESVETDEVFFDIISEISFCETKPDIELYLTKFIKQRYGFCNCELLQAWKILANKVYHGDTQEGGDESPFCCRPSLTVNRVSQWGGASTIKDPSILLSVINLLLTQYDIGKSSVAYCYDLIDFTRQLLANDSWNLVYGLQQAFSEQNIPIFQKYSYEFLERFDLMEKLLSTHTHFLIGHWFERAKNLGRTDLEKRWFEWNARTQITVWAPKIGDILHDYAAKEYSGMICDFYKPRWEAFISMLEMALLTGESITEYERYDQEVLFTYERKVYPTIPTGDTKEAVSEVLRHISYM